LIVIALRLLPVDSIVEHQVRIAVVSIAAGQGVRFANGTLIMTVYMD